MRLKLVAWAFFFLLVHVRSKVYMAPFHVRSKVCIFAQHMDGSIADFAPHMEGSPLHFAPNMEQRHSFRGHQIGRQKFKSPIS